MAQHGVYALELLIASLLFGTLGFHLIASQPWIDAFLNTSMLLGGMGPVGDIRSTAGKLFASFFALYAGLMFLAVGTLLLAPVIHRFLHRFHLEETRGKRGDS